VRKPPVVLDLAWIHGLEFSGRCGDASMILDSAGAAGPSPVQTLAFALAGCMAMDVEHMLAKGRHRHTALRLHLVGERADHDPHRFVRISLQFTVEGDVPEAAIHRAVALSREKYCSVWHSMRQDIDLTVSWTLTKKSRHTT
jgi:putative redox protein